MVVNVDRSNEAVSQQAFKLETEGLHLARYKVLDLFSLQGFKVVQIKHVDSALGLQNQ